MISIDKNGVGRTVGKLPSGYRSQKIVIDRADVEFLLSVVANNDKEFAVKWFKQLVSRFDEP
jgi:hypothetical protein